MNTVNYIQNTNENIELIIYKAATHSYPTHNHSQSFTIGLLVSGQLSLEMNNKSITCSLAEPFMIPPYMTHSLKTDSSYDMILLSINKQLIAEADFLLKIDCFIKKAILKNYISSENGSLLTAYVRSLSQQNAFFIKETMAAITNALPFLERFPEKKFTIEELSQASNLSKYYFIRQFKDMVGLTPHQFQLQNRIRKAQRMLTHERSLTTVALDTGFYDQSHFIREFNKSVQLTPSDYKKSRKFLD